MNFQFYIFSSLGSQSDICMPYADGSKNHFLEDQTWFEKTISVFEQKLNSFYVKINLDQQFLKQKTFCVRNNFQDDCRKLNRLKIMWLLKFIFIQNGSYDKKAEFICLWIEGKAYEFCIFSLFSSLLGGK